jgi:hypothetical protein
MTWYPVFEAAAGGGDAGVELVRTGELAAIEAAVQRAATLTAELVQLAADGVATPKSAWKSPDERISTECVMRLNSGTVRAAVDASPNSARLAHLIGH